MEILPWPPWTNERTRALSLPNEQKEIVDASRRQTGFRTVVGGRLRMSERVEPNEQVEGNRVMPTADVGFGTGLWP